VKVICADCNIDMQHTEKGVYVCLNCGNAVRVVIDEPQHGENE
jgi:predicted RNA-binding Zn-ribbon protein involved in translation (DUF1610 family)